MAPSQGSNGDVPSHGVVQDTDVFIEPGTKRKRRLEYQAGEKRQRQDKGIALAAGYGIFDRLSDSSDINTHIGDKSKSQLLHADSEDESVEDEFDDIEQLDAQREAEEQKLLEEQWTQILQDTSIDATDQTQSFQQEDESSEESDADDDEVNGVNVRTAQLYGVKVQQAQSVSSSHEGLEKAVKRTSIELPQEDENTEESSDDSSSDDNVSNQEAVPKPAREHCIKIQYNDTSQHKHLINVDKHCDDGWGDDEVAELERSLDESDEADARHESQDAGLDDLFEENEHSDDVPPREQSNPQTSVQLVGVRDHDLAHSLSGNNTNTAKPVRRKSRSKAKESKSEVIDENTPVRQWTRKSIKEKGETFIQHKIYLQEGLVLDDVHAEVLRAILRRNGVSVGNSTRKERMVAIFNENVDRWRAESQRTIPLDDRPSFSKKPAVGIAQTVRMSAGLNNPNQDIAVHNEARTKKSPSAPEQQLFRKVVEHSIDGKNHQKINASAHRALGICNNDQQLDHFNNTLQKAKAKKAEEEAERVAHKQDADIIDNGAVETNLVRNQRQLPTAFEEPSEPTIKPFVDLTQEDDENSIVASDASGTAPMVPNSQPHEDVSRNAQLCVKYTAFDAEKLQQTGFVSENIFRSDIPDSDDMRALAERQIEYELSKIPNRPKELQMNRPGGTTYQSMKETSIPPTRRSAGKKYMLWLNGLSRDDRKKPRRIILLECEPFVDSAEIAWWTTWIQALPRHVLWAPGTHVTIVVNVSPTRANAEAWTVEYFNKIREVVRLHPKMFTVDIGGTELLDRKPEGLIPDLAYLFNPADFEAQNLIPNFQEYMVDERKAAANQLLENRRLQANKVHATAQWAISFFRYFVDDALSGNFGPPMALPRVEESEEDKAKRLGNPLGAPGKKLSKPAEKTTGRKQKPQASRKPTKAKTSDTSTGSILSAVESAMTPAPQRSSPMHLPKSTGVSAGIHLASESQSNSGSMKGTSRSATTDQIFESPMRSRRVPMQMTLEQGQDSLSAQSAAPTPYSRPISNATQRKQDSPTFHTTPIHGKRGRASDDDITRLTQGQTFKKVRVVNAGDSLSQHDSPQPLATIPPPPPVLSIKQEATESLDLTACASASQVLEPTVVFQKEIGKLSIAQNGKTLTFKPNQISSHPLSLIVTNITKIGQSPSTSAKVVLGVHYKTPSFANERIHKFLFVSPADALNQCTAFKNAVEELIDQSVPPGNSRIHAMGTSQEVLQPSAQPIRRPNVEFFPMTSQTGQLSESTKRGRADFEVDEAAVTGRQSPKRLRY